jgi:argininosuccinate lyase
VIGNLVQSLALLKSQPLTYNKDNQEDKESLFDTVDTLLISLRVMAAMLPAMTFDGERGAAAAVANFALATDLADYLAKRGVPFRDAHEAVGQLVAKCERDGKTFEQLSIEEYHEAHEAFDEDVLAIDLTASLAARDVPGGTAPKAVSSARNAAQSRLDAEEQRSRSNDEGSAGT